MKTVVKRNLIRAAIGVVWIGLAAYLFMAFRGHTVLVDNKAAADGSYQAFELVAVSIDGGKPVEYFEGDRDRAAVVGTRHRVELKFADGRPPFKGEFVLDRGTDVFLLSLPKLAAGIEPFVEPFVQPDALPRDGGDGSDAPPETPQIDPAP